MSKLDLLPSVIIFPFGTMNLKGRDRKYTTFYQIALKKSQKAVYYHPIRFRSMDNSIINHQIECYAFL